MSKSTLWYYVTCAATGGTLASGGIGVTDVEFYIICALIFIARVTGQFDGETK